MENHEMGLLNNKIAIVTGAGQGIGRGIALAMAKEGAIIVIVELNKDTADQTADEIKSLGGRALAITCNVRKRDEVDVAVAATIKEFGTVDILVNNAQTARANVSFEDTTDEDMALTLESGFMGTFYFMQACFPYLKEHGGKVINLGSSAGTEGLVGHTAYAAGKEAIRGLSRVAAHEWGKYKINVNVICPAANSPGWQSWAKSYPEQVNAALARNPMGRVGDCEKDIGRTAVFLASADSDYISAHTFMVDGGLAPLT